MTVLNFPTLSKRSLVSFEFTLMTNTQTFNAPLTGQTQTLELPGSKWSCTMSFQNLSELDGRLLKAFVASLRGQAGRVNLWDMSHETPSGQIDSNGFVSGAGQTGRSIQVRWNINPSWAVELLTADNANTTCDTTTDFSCDGTKVYLGDWLLPGDYICIGNELKMITKIITMTGTGIVSLAFEPPMRNIPVDGSVVNVFKTTAVMKLLDDNQGKFTMQQSRVFSPVLSFVEVFQ